MFLFHDMTQYARVLEFSAAITSLHIPPVYAAHFNFDIGYPIFLFYAPLAYWVTSVMFVLGFTVVNAVRLSMLAALLVGALGMYAWLTKRYTRLAAFAGAILFVSSPWVASEIFVRGNLATIWFLALAPWSLWSLWQMRRRSIAPIIIIPLTLMTHNALSLIWVSVLFGYTLFGFTQRRSYRMRFLLLTVLISGIFWIPAITQLGQTHATEIAKLTRYSDHFLCIQQLWTTPSWGFGGSAPGCTADGMSFMLGKLQILCAILGLIVGPLFILRRRLLFVEGLIVIWTLFLSLPDSLPFWKLLPQLQAIQFPWRFLSITLIFLAALSAAAVHVLIGYVKIASDRNKLRIPSLPYTISVCIGLCFILSMIFASTKYFYGKTISIEDINRRYASESYISQSAAYEIPEYVPKTVDYAYWQRFRTEKPSSADISKLRKDFARFHPQSMIQIGASILALVSIILIIWLL